MPISVDYDECRDQQEQEVIALESIYPDDFTYRRDEITNQIVGNIAINVTLPQISSGERNESAEATDDDDGCLIFVYDILKPAKSIPVKNLPPVIINFQLPETYPFSEPSIKIACNWLSGCVVGNPRTKSAKLSKDSESDPLDGLCLRKKVEQKLLDMCKEQLGEVVLFPLAEWIRQEMLDFLHISREIGVDSAILHEIQAYNQSMLLDQYNRTIFKCGICLSERKGSSCFQFVSCGHVFCTQCLTDFFEMLIKEGLVRSVKCPHPSCTSENARLSSRELETLLPEAVMERYNFLYTQQSYELDPQITWCVLPHCRGPAKKSADSSKGAYEKLATCLKCGYNFCHWCSKTWHGTQTFCEVKNGDKVVTDYLNGDDNIKRRIEVQYGKSIVAKMVQKYREEEATKAFLKSTATPCPSCSTYITKTEGCNHMTCQSCQTHFCYRCGSYLPSSNPYSHYNFGGSSCYGQLFDSLHTDDDALFEFAFV